MNPKHGLDRIVGIVFVSHHVPAVGKQAVHNIVPRYGHARDSRNQTRCFYGCGGLPLSIEVWNAFQKENQRCKEAAMQILCQPNTTLSRSNKPWEQFYYCHTSTHKTRKSVAPTLSEEMLRNFQTEMDFAIRSKLSGRHTRKDKVWATGLPTNGDALLESSSNGISRWWP